MFFELDCSKCVALRDCRAVAQGWPRRQVHKSSANQLVVQLPESVLLKRLLPRIDPQLDESQAGFRRGAEEQVYTLAETVRLRAGRRTFCAFVDVRKAFDVAWRDAVLVKLAATGVTGSLWSVSQS